MRAVEELFMEIDATWKPVSSRKVRLGIIGSAALLLQTDYARGTKDSDILETSGLADETKARLLAIAGEGTAMHQRHRMYVDIVRGGVPFLPQVPKWRAVDALNARLEHFELDTLDIVDVVVSKLKRFSANDIGDVRAMIEGGHAPRDAVVSRFREAVDFFAGDARAEEIPRYVENLHRIERDLFLTDETEIALPGWV